MKSLLPNTTAAVFLAGLFATTIGAAAETSSGYVDFGKIAPTTEGKFVEVDLPEGLIKFAAKIATKADPQAAEVLGNLEHVRVNVVELNAANREAIVGRVQAIRQELAAQGWSPIVNVREQPRGDDVQIFAKTRGEEAIAGLVITVVEGSREVVLVNIVGNIKPEQIATLADRFDIEPLKRIKVAAVK
jgi:hypothetical protein